MAKWLSFSCSPTSTQNSRRYVFLCKNINSAKLKKHKKIRKWQNERYLLRLNDISLFYSYSVVQSSFYCSESPLFPYTAIFLAKHESLYCIEVIFYIIYPVENLNLKIIKTWRFNTKLLNPFAIYVSCDRNLVWQNLKL